MEAVTSMTMTPEEKASFVDLIVATQAAQQTRQSKMWDYILKVAGITLPIILAGVVWLAAGRIELDKRLVAIESNRFTNEDGRQLRNALIELEKINAARNAQVLVALEAIKNMIPIEVPPAWFVGRVEHVEKNQEKLEQRVRALEQRDK